MRVGFAALLILAGLLGCSSTGAKTGPSHHWIANRGGLWEGADASRVTRIAARFAGSIAQPFLVRVLDSDQANGWAWPSGDIYLTRGLVRMLEDAEIAAVTAHELGHLLQEGHLRATAASLTGANGVNDCERAADRQGLSLLAEASVEPTALRSALSKVAHLAVQDPQSRRHLSDRIAHLP